MRLHASKLIVLALVVLAFGALTAVASADGNGTQTTQFKVTYHDGFGYENTCSGVNQVKKDGSAYDSETCIVSGDTSRFVAGTYESSTTTASGCGVITPGAPGYGPGGIIFLSDYPGLAGKCGTSWTETFTPNADGTWTIEYKVQY